MLNSMGLDPTSFINKHFELAQHCSFIVNNKVIKDMFKQLVIVPTIKDESCAYERIYGIYFLNNNITTINLYNFMDKIFGGRT